MIIAIEGMDGVGKTTIAKILSKRLNFQYIKEPLEELFELNPSHLRKISEKIFNNFSSKLISLYLSLGDSYILEKYKNQNIILDRHVLLNYFWNGNEDTKDLFLVEKKMFGCPELIIILEASVETRKKRITERDHNDEDLNSEKKMSYGYDKLINYVEDNNYRYIVINTDTMNIDKVISECLKQIKILDDKIEF
jgi:thymidylate kinase